MATPQLGYSLALRETSPGADRQGQCTLSAGPSCTASGEEVMVQKNLNELGYRDAVAAIEENLRLLDPQKHKTLHNLTIAIAVILKGQSRLWNDMDLLHNKMQPILKHLEEDNDWRSKNYRNRNPNFEG